MNQTVIINSSIFFKLFLSPVRVSGEHLLHADDCMNLL